MKALAVYEAVARKGGFRAAAAELGIDHLTVARQVRLLESELGVRLVALHSQKLRITAHGQGLLREARPAIETLATLLAARTEGVARSPLRIACEPGFLGCWMMPRIRTLRERHPDLNFILLPASSALRQVDVEADLTVTFAENVAQRDILICRPGAIAVCSPQLMERHRGFPTIASLMEATLIHDDSEHYWSWWLGCQGVAPRSPSIGSFLQVMDARLAVEAAREGIGVALLNTLIAKDDIDSGRLVKARPEIMFNETYVARVINPARHKEVRAVVAWIKRLVRSEQSGLEPSAEVNAQQKDVAYEADSAARGIR
jgi:LysR family glycine cleavage system transcriptional activator